MENHYYNKKYIVNPKFQYWFLGCTLGIFLLCFACFYLGQYFFFDEFLSRAKDLGLPENHAFYTLLSGQKAVMDKILFGVGAGLFSILFISNLLISNRVAGPLFRLERELRGMVRKGKIHKIIFRENDFFQEIPDMFNELPGINERNLNFTDESEEDEAA